MACPLTQNYVVKNCKDAGGIKSIRLIESDNITSKTVTSGVITAYTLAATRKFFKYGVEAETADFKNTFTGDGKNKTYGGDLELNFMVYGLEPVQNDELMLLIKNKLVAIVELSNGTFWEVGGEYGLDVASDAFESGVAFNDFTGSKIQLKGRTTVKPVKVDSAIISTITNA